MVLGRTVELNYLNTYFDKAGSQLMIAYGERGADKLALLMEFADGKNTGRTVRVLVTYILEDYTGIEDGYCIMATKLMKDGEEHEL